MEFKKGMSGNPAGRPKGAKNKAAVISQALIDGKAEALVKKVVQLALEGDAACLKICLQRLLPLKKEAPIEIDLPEVQALADIPKMLQAVIAQMREGEITPSEAEVLIELTDSARKTMEITELEQRISALEQMADAHHE